MKPKKPLNILHLDASARHDGSISRTLTADLVAALEDRHGEVTITRRDLADGIPLITADWVEANFTPVETRSPEQRATLSLSDELVAELVDADIVVIGSPIYNFSVPAALKAWIDMIARARLTFRYTDAGVQGLLKGKKAYIVAPSGGVRVGSPVDFATPYLRHALGFVGITDVEIVGARGADRDDGESLDNARSRIAELVHIESQAA